MELTIRPVTLADVPAIHAIYSNSVLTYTASWELAPPTEDEMRRRVQAILDQGFPYFVGLLEQNLVGYTYASTYRPRPGYRFTVEDSIYVDPAYQRRGIARQLLNTLIDGGVDAEGVDVGGALWEEIDFIDDVARATAKLERRDAERKNRN